MDLGEFGPWLSAGVGVAIETLRKSFGGTNRPRRRTDRMKPREYDRLREDITPNSVTLLVAAEPGEPFSVRTFRRIVCSMPHPSPKELDWFESGLGYHLEFLDGLGVLTRTTRGFAITGKGQTFLAEARRRRHYAEVLSKPSFD